MAMYVNTNVSSLSGQRNLQNVTDRMNSSFEKLSSGSRINSARDDSAGLQIADRLTTQLTGLNQANRNANDGISIAQIAEGALSEVTSNVQRMRQLVVQGGNRTLSADDRSALGQEFSKLLATNDDIAERTAYGTIKVLNYESNEAGFQIQSGAQSGEQDTVTTGNAKLTALFGTMLNNDEVTGTISELYLGTTALSEVGILGEVIGAYQVLNGNSQTSVAMNELFGAGMTSQTELNISELATDSTLQLDMDRLTTLLTSEISGGAAGAVGADGDLDTITALGGAAFEFLGFSAGDVDSNVGFTDAQVNGVHGFLTDTLMDMMSGLVTAVDVTRAKLGAEQNGLASTVRSNSAAIVNVSDSRARIQDTDFAAETAELTRNQIIQQAATSILSQANQLPNAALSLLR